MKPLEIIRRSTRRKTSKDQMKIENAFEVLRNESSFHEMSTVQLEEEEKQFNVSENILFEIVNDERVDETPSDDIQDDFSDRSSQQGIILQDHDESYIVEGSDEEWPAAQNLSQFPKQIIKDGLLLIKGKKLMQMICSFYKLECNLCDKKLRFRQVKALFEHFLVQHKTEGFLSCCSLKLTRMPAIINHMCR